MDPPAASAPPSSRLADAPPRPRSVLPGRQRWEVAAVRGRPNLARLLESSLQATPGIDRAEVSPVTGRVLLFHETTLSSREAARLLGGTVAQVLTRLTDQPGNPRRRTPPGGQREASGRVPRRTPRRADGGSDGAQPVAGGGSDRAQPVADGVRRSAGSGLGVLAVAGAGTGVALALGAGKHVLRVLAKPWLSLGICAAATAAVVRNAWRRSNAARAAAGATDASGASETASGATRRHFLARLVGRRRGKFTLAAALSVLAQVTELSLFAALSYTVTALASGGSQQLAGLGLVGLKSQLTALAGVMGLTAAVSTGLSYLAAGTWNQLARSVESDLRTSTYAHVQRLSTADLEGERTSHTTQVLTEDISSLGDFIGRTLHESTQLATCFAVLAPAFLTLAPQLAWLAFAPIPVVAWLSFRSQERTAGDRAASAAARSRLHARLTDNLQANVMVKAACTEEYEEQRVAELCAEYGEASRRTDRSSALQAQLVRLCAFAAVPGAVLLGGNAFVRGELPLERFTPLLDLPAMTLARLYRLGDLTESYRRSVDAFARVQRLLDLPTEPAEGSRELPADGVRGELSLQKVTFAYPGRPPALRDLSLTIAPGRVTGIVGATGAGKTTIAKLLMRFRDPTTGQVLLDGVDVSEVPLHELRSVIGYVSQEPFVFDGTIAENIRYGTFDADQRRVVQAARCAGADSFIESLPNGYDTQVGERGGALSGGQRQRIALARTFLADPPVVILDEATSAVDNETEAAIQRSLEAFARKRTLIVIAHRLSTIRNADTIYVMERGGSIAECGTHTELVQRGGRYAKLWQLQAGEPSPSQPAEREGQPPTWLRALPS
ncbi:ABC transporter ATP-binding protein [Streptomyces oryzae]|uniref:ABC transporter ATP-binding protein n=2 Tax=Streptomyces oryzae TaxID=1434886 RepID=A0ABS3XG01_9ACTN|nr:ABC transporter ATP-binding protein [Streptomyces oryzae]